MSQQLHHLVRPLSSHTPASKTRQDKTSFLSQHDGLLDEPVFESIETLFDQEKVDSSPSSPFNLLPILLNTHVHLMTPNTLTPLMDPASQELAGVTSKREHPNMDPASWKLTGEEKLRPTTQVNACSLKLIGELNPSFFLYLAQIDHDGEPKDLFTPGLWGGLPQIFSSCSWRT